MKNFLSIVLKNRGYIFCKEGLFNKNGLKITNAIITSKLPSNLTMNEKQKDIIRKVFINSNNIFNEDTPDFIKGDISCMKASISRNVDSIKYIDKILNEIKNYIIIEAIKQKYVIRENSDYFLRMNYEVILNSIRIDAQSANYSIWFYLNDNEKEKLISELLQSDYVLSKKHNRYLYNNRDIVLNSIKKDINSFKYASKKFIDDEEIFNYLFLNGYNFDKDTLSLKKIKWLQNEDFSNLVFKSLGIYKETSSPLFCQRFSKIFSDMVNVKPTIKMFSNVFELIAEEKWRKHKNNNFYTNIFGKICSALKNADNFENAINNTFFINEMKETLGTKYYSLYKAMNEYFNIYHSDIDDKIDKLSECKNTIASLSALYISIKKEKYKKEIINKNNKWLKRFFILNTNNPVIYNRILSERRKEKFRNFYRRGKNDIRIFLGELEEKYSTYIDQKIVRKLIYNFIRNQYSKIEDIIDKPLGYNEYERYKKAIKLINRLNSNYIKYASLEVHNYKDIIVYDSAKKEYIYTGTIFEDNKIEEFNYYKKIANTFDKIKREITIKINEIQIENTDINSKLYDKNIPFTDEYYEFNLEYLEHFDIVDLIKECLNDRTEFYEDSFIDDESYKYLYDLLINNGLLWLLLFQKNEVNCMLGLNYINPNEIVSLFDNTFKIINLSNNINLLNSYDIFLINRIYKYGDGNSIATLGIDIMQRLCKSTSHTSNKVNKIITIARDLVCEMSKRKESTVPYVYGQYLNYKYSMYDSQDADLLLCGIKTDSCFKIGGTDNDFMHYCALNKNGFIIKITDIDNNFIARASGFRHGNCIFVNQLRTIYDEGGNEYTGKSYYEKKDIIETFKVACQNIIDVSQNNKEELDKIDFAFVTQSYILDNYPSNVSYELQDYIGCSPMDLSSSNWKEFVLSTKNLQTIEDYYDYFMTDYGDYKLICIANSKNNDKIEVTDLNLKDVKALYERKRNEIIVSTSQDKVSTDKVNKISGIKSYFDNSEFEIVKIPKHALILTGDNWYIIYKNGIINSCLLDFDESAKVEFNFIKNILENIKIISTETIDVSKLKEKVKSLKYK